MVFKTVRKNCVFRHREGELGYLFAEWLVAMGIFIFFITMLTIPSFRDWHDNQTLRQGAAEMYLTLHRIQNISILSNGRDRPELDRPYGNNKAGYMPRAFNKTHDIMLPPNTRFSGDRAVFKKTGVRAHGYGDLRVWRSDDYDKAYIYIVARSTGRIRMERTY